MGSIASGVLPATGAEPKERINRHQCLKLGSDRSSKGAIASGTLFNLPAVNYVLQPERNNQRCGGVTHTATVTVVGLAQFIKAVILNTALSN